MKKCVERAHLRFSPAIQLSLEKENNRNNLSLERGLTVRAAHGTVHVNNFRFIDEGSVVTQSPPPNAA